MKKKLTELRKNNNWQGIIGLLQPRCAPGLPGWQDAELLGSLGFAHSQTGKLDAAEKYYRRWVEVESDRARPLYCLGYIFYLKENWREAIRWFEQALKLFPEYLVCRYRLGYAFWAFDKPRKSKPHLEKVLSLYRQNSDPEYRRKQKKTYCKATFLLAKVYYKIKEPHNAHPLLQELLVEDKKDFVPLPHKLYAMGKVLCALKREQQALDMLHQALNPHHPQHYVYDQMGRVYHQLKEYRQAVQMYQKALQARQLPYILYDRALSYFADGQIAPAQADLHQALKRDRKAKHKIYLLLGKISLHQQKFQEAMHYFKHALQWKQEQYQADYAEAHYQLALCLLQQGDRQAASDELQIALEVDPQLEWDSALSELVRMPVAAETEEAPQVF